MTAFLFYLPCRAVSRTENKCNSKDLVKDTRIQPTSETTLAVATEGIHMLLAVAVVATTRTEQDEGVATIAVTAVAIPGAVATSRILTVTTKAHQLAALLTHHITTSKDEVPRWSHMSHIHADGQNEAPVVFPLWFSWILQPFSAISVPFLSILIYHYFCFLLMYVSLPITSYRYTTPVVSVVTFFFSVISLKDIFERVPRESKSWQINVYNWLWFQICYWNFYSVLVFWRQEDKSYWFHYRRKTLCTLLKMLIHVHLELSIMFRFSLS